MGAMWSDRERLESKIKPRLIAGRGNGFENYVRGDKECGVVDFR